MLLTLEGVAERIHNYCELTSEVTGSRPKSTLGQVIIIGL